jgi:hypothetical protein
LWIRLFSPGFSLGCPEPFPFELGLDKTQCPVTQWETEGSEATAFDATEKSSLKTKQVATHNGNHSDEDEEDSGEHETQPKKVDEADTYSKASDHHEEDVMGTTLRIKLRLGFVKLLTL